jgi:hypothetical protein
VDSIGAAAIVPGCMSTSNHLPGVAVRAEIVLQCLKLGLINHLILDTDCADELHRLAR